MPRPITPPSLKDINYSVKLSPADMAYLGRFKAELSHVAISEAVRDIIAAFRTTFGLPPYQVKQLHEDMAARKLNLIQYLQELLARRYEEISTEVRAAPRQPGRIHSNSN